MNRPKIILLAHEDLYGGGTRQTFYIMQALAKIGYEIVLISNAEKTWLGQNITKTGLPIKPYYTNLIRRKIQLWQELKLLGYVCRIYLKEKPDVVFASGVKLIGLSGIAGWLCRVPRRVAIIRGEGAPPGSRLLTAIYFMERLIAGLGTEFIAVSDYIRNQLLIHKICTQTQVVTIHDGIDLSIFSACQAALSDPGLPKALFPSGSNSANSERVFRIGMVGRFVSGKRYDQFIAVMQCLCKEFPLVYGFLIGEGEDRSRLEALIQETGFADRILITGQCSNMPAVYQNLDLTVLFTDYEGCPNVILESFASGVPVVASDVCGIPELIRDGDNGFLIAPGNIEDAIQKISQLINNPSLRLAFKDKGYEAVDHHFNLEKQVAQIIQFLFPNTPA